MGLRELHVALDGLAVQALGLGDLLRAFGERSGQVAAGQIKPQTAAQQGEASSKSSKSASCPSHVVVKTITTCRGDAFEQDE